MAAQQLDSPFEIRMSGIDEVVGVAGSVGIQGEDGRGDPEDGRGLQVVPLVADDLGCGGLGVGVPGAGQLGEVQVGDGSGIHLEGDVAMGDGVEDFAVNVHDDFQHGLGEGVAGEDDASVVPLAWVRGVPAAAVACGTDAVFGEGREGGVLEFADAVESQLHVWTPCSSLLSTVVTYSAPPGRRAN